MMDNDNWHKVFNLDVFYLIFFLSMGCAVIKYRNYLDIIYFLLITVYYIRLKIHQKGI